MTDQADQSTSTDDDDRALVARLINRSGQPDLFRATVHLLRALLPVITPAEDEDDQEDLLIRAMSFNDQWDELEYLILEHPPVRGDESK